MLYKPNERAIFLDILKGFAIFLVVLGHTPLCGRAVIQWIYSFHMPVFFAAYGMSYEPEKHMEKGWLNKRFLLAKIKRLLVPCFVWGAIYSDFTPMNLVRIAYASQATFRSAASLTSLWFLPCMFLAVCVFELLMWGVSRLFPGDSGGRRRGTILALTAALLLIAGDLLPRISHGYPWSADVALIAAAFMIIGYGVRTLVIRFAPMNNGNTAPWLAVLLGAFLLSLTFLLNLNFITGKNADLATRSLGKIGLYLLTAGSGLAFLTALSVLLVKNRSTRRIAVFGVYSMPIFLLHKPLVLAASAFFDAHGVSSPLFGLAIALAAMLLCCITGRILAEIAPNLIGLDRSPKDKHRA